MSLPEIHLATDGELNYALFKHDDIVSNAVRKGGYETELHAYAKLLLKDFEHGLVLDIGANLGSFTVPVAKAHPHLNFASFEPQRIIYMQLCTNVFLNRLDNVMPYQWALSDADWNEIMELPNYAEERNIGAFSIDKAVRENNYEVQSHGAMEQINATLLDKFMFNNIRLIKIDVEGHELEVLRGAYHTLEENKFPPIIFESWTWKFQNKRQELFNYLKDLGYEISEVGQNNIAVKK